MCISLTNFSLNLRRSDQTKDQFSSERILHRVRSLVERRQSKQHLKLDHIIDLLNY